MTSEYVNKCGQLHRDNGLPAIERTDGSNEWYVNGLRHRDGGLPAITMVNERNEWWVNGTSGN